MLNPGYKTIEPYPRRLKKHPSEVVNALFNLGFDEAKIGENMLISRGGKSKENKTNKWNNRERMANLKTYLQYKPKRYVTAIYNKKPNYLIEHRY